MPELPEVESIKKGLQATIINRVIKHTTIFKPKIVSSSSNIRTINELKVDEFQVNTIGATILNVSRVAKNLIIELSTGILIIHLKMTGQVVYGNNLANKHTCIDFILDDDAHLLYNDIRQFGYVLYFPSYEVAMSQGYLQGYGQDPYTQKLFPKVIHARLSKIKKPIKSVFFDQKVICGLGNIYADEVAFDSGILPTRIASELSAKEVEVLTSSITRIIHDAVSKGGSSISNYVLADGTRGTYANYHKVYGRKNQVCVKCLNLLSNTKVNARMTVFCSICQI
jgi:formamidopyrimidine-DNA glycosylase